MEPHPPRLRQNRKVSAGAAEGSMPERRQEKRPPFNEKGGVLLEVKPETVGLEAVRRPLQTVRMPPKAFLTGDFHLESHVKNGHPLFGCSP
ncbi:hypothetical protein VL06_20835 [Rossellomorea marisflavi]|nr:hypothetical protein VL06_20835 [Rossellomorea marisflavi]